jgi:hypothetical protein
MKVVLIIIFLAFIGCRVNHNSEFKTDGKISFFDRSRYYNRNIDSTDLDSTWEKKGFFMLNEEDFLFADFYDYYIIYSYQEWGERDKKMVHLIIKAYDSIGLISRKKLEFEESAVLYSRSNQKVVQTPYAHHTTSKVVSLDSVIAYKRLVDSIIPLLHEQKVLSYDDNPSSVYYYDGKNYFCISANFSNHQIMARIDSLFLKSSLFNGLREKF